VNFKRFAPCNFASSLWTTFLPATSTIATEPSCASAAQSSAPFGETYVQEAERPRGHVGRDDVLEIGRDDDHVGPVFPRSQGPVDHRPRRIVRTDDLRAFGGEPHLSAGVGETVGPAQRSEIDGRQRRLRGQVDHGQRVVSATAVIRHVSELAVRRRDDLVRIVTHGDARDDLERGGVHDREHLVVLREHQKRR
jgi:hypothetical protein